MNVPSRNGEAKPELGASCTRAEAEKVRAPRVRECHRSKSIWCTRIYYARLKATRVADRSLRIYARTCARNALRLAEQDLSSSDFFFHPGESCGPSCVLREITELGSLSLSLSREG